jgi:predicted flavoprotein YhiN
MCAVEAGGRGRRVAVIERAERVGKKILISGGGRCNFTNLHCGPENFISANSHFAKSALAQYGPADFIALVEKHHIAYHEKTLGQLFCDRSAAEITTMLEAECRAAGVRIFLGRRICEVSRSAEFVVRTEGEEFRAAALMVATGGLSIPKMGAGGFGYELARQFGLKIQATRPGLTPLVLGAQDRKDYCDLTGVSAEVVVATENRMAAARTKSGTRARPKAMASDAGNDRTQVSEGETWGTRAPLGGRQEFREKMLITHRGLSGPAILQISSYWNAGQTIRIDLAPGRDLAAVLRDGRDRNMAAARSALREFLPSRLAARWLELHEPSSWTNSALAELDRAAHEWVVLPAGTEGYEKAEVTAGGVDTDELSSKTMESRAVPGLFFIGEVVDVTGHLGGHNFQWAWASGVAAGRAV